MRAIKNASYRHSFVMLDDNGFIERAAITFTPATKVYYSKDFGGLTESTNAIVIDRVPLYSVTLTAAEMGGDTVDIYALGQVGNDIDTFHFASIPVEPALDSGVTSTVDANSIYLASTANATADYYNGAIVEIVSATAGAGQTRTITNYSTSRQAFIDRPWTTNPSGTIVYKVYDAGVPLSQDDTNSAMQAMSDIHRINSDRTAAQNLELLYEGAFITSSVADSAPSVTRFDADGTNLQDVDDYYNDMLLVFTSGACQGIPRKVTDFAYVDTKYRFTVDEFPALMANNDTFILIALIA